MLKLDDLPQISGMDGPDEEGEVGFDLEGPLPDAEPNQGKVIFVGQYCQMIVVCVGEVLEYKEHPEYQNETQIVSRLKMKGSYVAFAFEGR